MDHVVMTDAAGTSPEGPGQDPRPGTAAWWLAREKRPGPKRHRALTLEAILDAGMALLDTGGAAALTMRNVAGALGCKQASLYRHVRNREELVTLLADRGVRVASAPPPGDLDWVGRAAWSSRLFRDHLLRHPGLASLLHGTERLGPNSLAGVEYALDLFTQAGMSPRVAAAAAYSLATFVVGSVQFNLGLDASRPDERRGRRLLYGSRDAAAFPLLVRHAGVLAEVDSDDEFEVGLGALLAGFRDLIEYRRKEGPLMADVELPSPIRAFIDTTNSDDSEGFVASFTEDAYLNDWGREFRGHEGVRSWNGTDNIGKQSRFSDVSVRNGPEPDSYDVTLKVTGNGYNGFGTLKFRLRDGLIHSLAIS